MKSTIVLAIAMTGIIFTACGGKKDSKATGDSKGSTATVSGVNPAIEAELNNTFKMINDGFAPGTAEMSKISDFDKEAKPFMMNEKNTGNFKTLIDNEEINIEKFYSANYTKPGVLYDIRFSASDKTLQKDTGTVDINLDAYVQVLDKAFGVKGVKGTESGFEDAIVWKTDKMTGWITPASNSFTLLIRKDLH